MDKIKQWWNDQPKDKILIALLIGILATIFWKLTILAIFCFIAYKLWHKKKEPEYTTFDDLIREENEK